MIYVMNMELRESLKCDWLQL